MPYRDGTCNLGVISTMVQVSELSRRSVEAEMFSAERVLQRHLTDVNRQGVPEFSYKCKEGIMRHLQQCRLHTVEGKALCACSMSQLTLVIAASASGWLTSNTF